MQVSFENLASFIGFQYDLMIIQKWLTFLGYPVYKITMLLKDRETDVQYKTDRCTIYMHGREQIKQLKDKRLGVAAFIIWGDNNAGIFSVRTMPTNCLGWNIANDTSFMNNFVSVYDFFTSEFCYYLFTISFPWGAIATRRVGYNK